MSDVNVTVTGSTIGLSVGPQSYYLSAYSTQDQTNAGATSVNKMTLNTTDLSTGVSIVNNSRITIANAGIFNIQFSAQVFKTSGGTSKIDIWLCKNGSNVANTNTEMEISGNSHGVVASWNFFVNAAAGDYYEICWSSADTNVKLDYTAAQSTPTRPAIPSIILTVHKIG